MLEMIESEEVKKKLVGFEMYEQIYKIDKILAKSDQKLMYLWHYIFPNLDHNSKFVRRRCF